MSSIATTLGRDFRRQIWLALGALALTGAGLAATLIDLNLDRGDERHYRAALELAQHIIVAQRYVGQIRLWQVRNAGAAPQAAAGPASDPRATLLATAAALHDAIATARPLAVDPVLAGELDRLDDTALAIGARAAAPDARRTPATTLALALEQEQLPVADDALQTLTAESQRGLERALARVRGKGDAARATLIAISVLAGTLAILLAIALAGSIQGSRRLVNQLNQMAHEDALTGLTNRRHLDEVLPTEVARARRAGTPLSVAMIDFDLFKRYNDQHGHAAGDALLRSAAQAWRMLLRPTDILARYGGEEFTLVLPGCGTEVALMLVERLRPAMPQQQTFSAGVATWDGNETAAALLDRADAALLQAKSRGRNCAVAASGAAAAGAHPAPPGAAGRREQAAALAR